MNFVEERCAIDFVDTTIHPGRILDRWLRATVLVRGQMSEFLEKFGLTEVRYSVLAALRSAVDTGMSQAELAERLMQSESNICTLVERMQQEGMIERLRSDADRRRRVLSLSQAGQQLFDQVEFARNMWAASLFEGLTSRDLSSLNKSFDHFSQNLDETSDNSRSSSTHSEGRSLRTSNVLPERPTDDSDNLGSPHLALSKVLSSLGINKRFEEKAA